MMWTALEVGLVAAAMKALFELAVLIGGAALPGQTLAGPSVSTPIVSAFAHVGVLPKAA